MEKNQVALSKKKEKEYFKEILIPAKSRKRGTECLITTSPLLTLLHAE